MVKKSVHWTQKPENKEKLLRMRRESAAKRYADNNKVTENPPAPLTTANNNTLLEKFSNLMREASHRLTVIDKDLEELTKERKEILANFPLLPEANKG